MFRTTGEILEEMIKYGYPFKEPRAFHKSAKGRQGYINSSRYKGTQAPIKMLENMREVYKEAKV